MQTVTWAVCLSLTMKYCDFYLDVVRIFTGIGMTGPLDIVFHLAEHLHMLPLAPFFSLHSPVLTLSGMHAVLESGAEDEGYRLSWGGRGVQGKSCWMCC